MEKPGQMCEVCSKLTIKVPERDFEPFQTLNKKMLHENTEVTSGLVSCIDRTF